MVGESLGRSDQNRHGARESDDALWTKKKREKREKGK